MDPHTASTKPGFEKRSGLDRRNAQRSSLCWTCLAGRRAAVRREEDRARSFQIDRHSKRTLAVILLIIALSILDAIFTLILTGRGASEINPIMAFLLDQGPIAFFSVKYLLTCVSILILLLNKNKYIFETRIRAKILLACSVIPFALVVNWELYLILSIP
jgi:hypothetical protein